MKKILRIATLIIVFSMLAACTTTPEAPAATDAPAVVVDPTKVPPTEVPATAVPATVVPLSPQEEWLKPTNSVHTIRV